MFLLDSGSQLDCLNNLFETGDSINYSEYELGQSPAHLAACGDQGFCLLWLLQAGADANQQDLCGETPVHKAARSGSLECISVLVASEAQIEICNHEGKTAEDIAWDCGFKECGRFLELLRMTRQSRAVVAVRGGSTACSSTSLAGQKRVGDSQGGRGGKKARDW